MQSPSRSPRAHDSAARRDRPAAPPTLTPILSVSGRPASTSYARSSSRRWQHVALWRPLDSCCVAAFTFGSSEGAGSDIRRSVSRRRVGIWLSRGRTARRPRPRPASGAEVPPGRCATRDIVSGARRCGGGVAGLVRLAAYLAELDDQGGAPASASRSVAAACFRAGLAGERRPGERTARVLAGNRRTGRDQATLATRRGTPAPGSPRARKGGGRRGRRLPATDEYVDVGPAMSI